MVACLVAAVAAVSTIALAASGTATEVRPAAKDETTTEKLAIVEPISEIHFSQKTLRIITEAEAEVLPLETAEQTPEPEWETIEVTAYCSCAKCCGEWASKRPNDIVYTASGAEAVEGVTVAADKSKYPFGTVLYIEGLGERIVQDVGGAIKGNRVDVYFNNHEDALAFGRQTLNAYVVSPSE
ncbi:hypothetical protein GKE99_05310 [Flavonifractor plautii]|uniref:3D domain-containing protein n=2 Tax=Flavonifractor plautii TaxID=292800 RepID=A0A6I2R0A2_FLAPL|nr:hypothetical protein [Flavonifractor plautii]MSB83620.1 hypothetical protein [Flavonifractor plautii]